MMAHKPLPIVTAKNLLYLIKVMHETIGLNPPKTLSKAKVMLSNFEVVTSEAIREELAPFAVTLANFYDLPPVWRDLVSAVSFDEPPTTNHLPSH